MTIKETKQRIINEIGEYEKISYRYGSLKLQHVAQELPPEDDTKPKSYQVKITLDGPPDVLMDVIKVEYQLHPTFKPNDRVTRQGTQPLKLRIWGEFSVRAVVHFKTGPPINIVRYLDLPN